MAPGYSQKKKHAPSRNFRHLESQLLAAFARSTRTEYVRNDSARGQQSGSGPRTLKAPGILAARERPTRSWVRQSVPLPLQTWQEYRNPSPARRGIFYAFEVSQEDTEAQSPSANLAGKQTGANG